MIPVTRRRAALIAAGACLPILASIYQLAAVRLAHQAIGASSWFDWADRLTRTRWTLGLLLAEGASFGLWMLALGELPLSVAFPLTATGSVLSLALAVFLLGEALPPLALLGTAAILSGAWLIVRSR